MNYQKEKLKDWILSLSVDGLKRIIEVDFNDYEDYVIKIAREELSMRKDDFRLTDLLRTDSDDSDCNEEFIETIRENVGLLSNEELLGIVRSDNSKYRKSAIDIAKEEMKKRNISLKKHFEIFMDLIKDVEFESVESSIATIYPKQFALIKKYKEVHSTLLQLEPSEGNADYLDVENEDLNWNVAGQDANSGERYGVEFYAWRDWLSFLIKDEQVYGIGKENYIAVCLITLTQYGFDEEEIQRKFRSMEIVNLSKSQNKEHVGNDQPIYECKEITLDRTLERAMDIKQEIIEKRAEKQGTLEVRPWIRFWARAIDNAIIGLFLGFAWLLAIPEIYFWDRSHTFGYGFSLMNFLIWALIEAYFLSKWGYTPGKWILNIKVSDGNENNLSYVKAFKRVLLVLLYGEGLLIPIVSFIANIVAYAKLTDKGITKWDEKMEVVVSYKKISIYKAVVSVLILIGIPIIMFVMYRRIMS